MQSNGTYRTGYSKSSRMCMLIPTASMKSSTSLDKGPHESVLRLLVAQGWLAGWLVSCPLSLTCTYSLSVLVTAACEKERKKTSRKWKWKNKTKQKMKNKNKKFAYASQGGALTTAIPEGTGDRSEEALCEVYVFFFVLLCCCLSSGSTFF